MKLLMLNTCAVYLTKMLLKNNAISEEDQDIYIYGWEMIISTAGSTIAIVLLSILLKQFLGTVLFLFFFLSLRAYAGGYHANSFLGCFCSTIITYLVALFISLKTPTAYIPLGMAILLLISVIIILLRAPQDHPNKPITTNEEREKLTRWSRLTAGGQVCIVVFFSWVTPSLIPYFWWATIGITAASGTLLVSNWRIQNQEKPTG